MAFFFPHFQHFAKNNNFFLFKIWIYEYNFCIFAVPNYKNIGSKRIYLKPIQSPPWWWYGNYPQ